MNKKMTTFFFALPILLSSLAGCSSIGKSVDLSNFKLANLEDYSSIGYGAVTERGQGQKTQKKNASSLASTSSVRARYFGKGSGVDYSDSPFTLLGQTKASGIEKLSFTDGSGVSEDVHINAFADFGPFIAFRVGDSITYYEENVPSYEISLNSGLACDQYILSKKTGKIYSVADFGLDWPEVGYNSGSVNGVVYATIKYRPGSCYKIYEEGETLKFEKLFGSNVTFQGVDRYGNILTNVAIVTAKGETRMLSSYLSGHASITFNEELSRIVASDDGKSYVLDGNGDFVQGAYGRVSKVRHGFDIFDAETFNDLPEFPGVSGSSAKTWQEYLPKGEQGFGDVNYNNPRSWYSLVIRWMEEHKKSLDDYDELLTSKFASLTEEELLAACSSCGIEGSLVLNEDGYLFSDRGMADIMNLGTPCEIGGCEYATGLSDGLNVLCKVSYFGACYGVSEFVETGGDWNRAIVRGNTLYYQLSQTSDNAIYKISLPSMERSLLKVDGYAITGISLDRYGDILVSGVDETLSDFSGYLDENEQVTFTKEETEFKSYTLYPIN